MKYTLPLLLAALVLIMSCSDDDRPLAAYRQDLAEVQINAGGQAKSLYLDDGTHLGVENTFATSYKDTLLRSAVLFVPTERGAQLQQLQEVLTAAPRQMEDSLLVCDPVAVHSVWRGGDFLNLHFSLLTGPSHSGHYIAFVHQGTSALASGGKLLKLLFYHYQNNDSQSYHQSAYASCRLKECGLLPGDSIAFTIQEETGEKTYRLPY